MILIQVLQWIGNDDAVKYRSRTNKETITPQVMTKEMKFLSSSTMRPLVDRQQCYRPGRHQPVAPVARVSCVASDLFRKRGQQQNLR